MQMKNVELAKQVAIESHFPDAMYTLQLLEWEVESKGETYYASSLPLSDHCFQACLRYPCFKRIGG